MLARCWQIRDSDIEYNCTIGSQCPTGVRSVIPHSLYTRLRLDDELELDDDDELLLLLLLDDDDELELDDDELLLHVNIVTATVTFTEVLRPRECDRASGTVTDILRRRDCDRHGRIETP